MATKSRVSLEEFLALPETKPYRELVDGEVIEKPMPNRKHSRMVVALIQRLAAYLDRSGEGDLDTELRHLERDSEWVFLPDLSVTLRPRRPTDIPAGPEEVLPSFAIEVLSPEDRPGRTNRRLALYMNAGVTLVWLVDPEDETITVIERGKDARIATAGDDIDGRPVLSGFALDVGELFAHLHEP